MVLLFADLEILIYGCGINLTQVRHSTSEENVTDFNTQMKNFMVFWGSNTTETEWIILIIILSPTVILHWII